MRSAARSPIHPADIAAVVSFLCRSEADHIRGQILHVNGGQYLAG